MAPCELASSTSAPRAGLPRKKPLEPEGGWPGGEAPKFVPFEGMVDSLDGNKDGVITLDEWINNLASLPGLKAAIEQNLDECGD